MSDNEYMILIEDKNPGTMISPQVFGPMTYEEAISFLEESGFVERGPYNHWRQVQMRWEAILAYRTTRDTSNLFKILAATHH